MTDNFAEEFVGCSLLPREGDYCDQLQVLTDPEHHDPRHSFYTRAGIQAFDETIEEASLVNEQLAFLPRCDPDVNDIIEDKKAQARESKQ